MYGSAGLLDAVLIRLLIDSEPCIFRKKYKAKNMILRGAASGLDGFTGTVRNTLMHGLAQASRGS